MKNIVIAALLGAASLSFVSCDSLSCITAANPQECLANKAIEKGMSYIADSGAINTKEQADALASNWSTVQAAIEGAQTLGVEIPSSAKKTYNDTLTRMKKHSYFNSEELKKAMSTAKTIK